MKKGNKGDAVTTLQVKLNLALAHVPHIEPLIADGHFGAKTETAVGLFCGEYVSKDQSGYKEADQFVLNALDRAIEPMRKQVVVLDAGHGGIDPETGEYTTPASNGKRYQHKGIELHTKDGWFYEGVENRIIANNTALECRKNEILCVTASHPYFDWWGTKSNGEELQRRGKFAAPYLANGFSVIFHSIHSNAAPTSDRTKEQLDKITGIEFYTTEAKTLSDKAVVIASDIWGNAFGKTALRAKDGIKTADFAVIKEAEKTAAYYKGKIVAMLSEDFVYTSEFDARRLVEPETRAARVRCAIEFYKRVFAEVLK